MDVFKVVVSVEGRDVSIHVKEGVLATVETGTLANDVRTPKNKVTAIVGPSSKGPVAWVQVASYDASRAARITHEGWVESGVGQVLSLLANDPAKASLSRESNPPADMVKCQEDAAFGSDACCTSSGNGCYVRCCGGCCSDPVGCPGAGCCP